MRYDIFGTQQYRGIDHLGKATYLYIHAVRNLGNVTAKHLLDIGVYSVAGIHRGHLTLTLVYTS